MMLTPSMLATPLQPSFHPATPHAPPTTPCHPTHKPHSQPQPCTIGHPTIHTPAPHTPRPNPYNQPAPSPPEPPTTNPDYPQLLPTTIDPALPTPADHFISKRNKQTLGQHCQHGTTTTHSLSAFLQHQHHQPCWQPPWMAGSSTGFPCIFGWSSMSPRNKHSMVSSYPSPCMTNHDTTPYKTCKSSHFL